MRSAGLRVALAAGEAAGQRVLRSMQRSGHAVVAVFAGGGATGAPVRAEADRLEVPVLPAAAVKDPGVASTLGPIDLFVNVHSLYVVSPELLEWPKLGAYNLHPGWLPDFAGRNCPSWAVWHDEPQPGVTVHRMTAEVDRGAVAFQERFPAGDDATGGSVAVECAKRGIDLVEQLVAAVADDTLVLHEQDPRAFTYYGRDVPHAGRVPFAATAATVDRLVRAADYGPFVSPWGTPRAVADDGALAVGFRRTRLTGRATDGAPGDVRRERDALLVACSDEWIEVTTLTIDGKTTPPAEALAGTRRLR